MLVYLSKKIAIPNDTLLATLSWHKNKGYIACGGEDGLLKVLKLEVSPCNDAKLKGLAAPSNLSMNQSLEGHNGAVQVVAWNEEHHKLTSSDQNGLIIVWMLYKGMWHEEMINNRNKSVVRHMKWNREGSKICIVYEDGAVIVGAVDGNRIWGKELKGVVLTHVQWSPDSKVILFGNNKGEVHIYTNYGTYNCKLTILCLSNVTGLVKLVGIDWFCGTGEFVSLNSPALAVVYDNGRAQLMRHELDDDPILLDTHMTVTCIQWNHSGSLLAFGGSQRFPDGKELGCVQFYTPQGNIMYTLRVPGRNMCALSWEGTGLRVALGVGPHIFFANIRHEYKWGYFSNTLVYSFRKPDKVEDCVIFWNVSTGEQQAKAIKNLVSITSCNDFCLLLARVDDNPSQCTLLLCDALGTPVDSRLLEMEPDKVYMSQTHIVAASSTTFFVWHYRALSRLASELTHISSRKKGRESNDRLIHIDDNPSVTSVTSVDFKKTAIKTGDPIVSICCSEKLLIVGRDSGLLQLYSLPKLALEGKQSVDCRPHQMAINSNSTKLSIIDTHGILSLYDVDKSGKELGTRLPLERKEVWDMCWAQDNPDLFAMMEKTRMYIFRGIDPEEPVVSSGNICHFEDMQVKSALLDEIMKDPENPTEDLVVELDIKSLRDTRDLLKVGIKDAHQFIEDNPHPRLWRLLAESALLNLELEVAEKAFVMSKDYQGIHFVKRLKKLDEAKQKAEVEAYFRRFEETESLYLEMDRRDLAVDLRLKLGDWFRVVQLIKSGGGAGDDTLLTQAWNAIGDYYAERQKWQHAVTYYNQGRNYEQLAECYYMLDDFSGLETLSSSLPPNHPLLGEIARKFITVGMCEQAVDAFLKVNKIKEAIDCCVTLNHWHLAVELAKKWSMKDVNSLLSKYAFHLLETDKILSAIELYRKANHFLNAAKLLVKIARGATAQHYNPLKVKKMYVLAAMMIEQHIKNALLNQKKKIKDEEGSVSDKRRAALKNLLDEDYSSALDRGLVSNPWRAAEAFHFFLLAQRFFYCSRFRESLRVAAMLREYEDVLLPTDLYSLLALSSLVHKAFGVCSKAFVKLESLESLSEQERQSYEALAVQVFTRYSPKEPQDIGAIKCPRCETINKEWDTRCASCDASFPRCLATGQLILTSELWVCRTCKHQADKHEVAGPFKNCPLCHSPI